MHRHRSISWRVRQLLRRRPSGTAIITVVVMLLAAASGLALAWNKGDTLLPSVLASLSTGDRERKMGADTSSISGQTPGGLAVPSKVPSDPRWAFVLLGYGGKGHDGGYLTDSILVSIVDPAQKTMTMLSVPRDSWVPLLFDGKSSVYNKVNTAYAFATDSTLYKNRLARYSGSHGAGTFSKDTLSRILGIPIANYLAMDFAGFRDMINTMGGIDVSVPDSFAARYPANDDPSIDPTWMTVRFSKGMEHMNGERAIEFARAREVIDNPSEASDFARSRRQRLIMESFKTRMFQAGGLIHLPQLIAIAAQHVDTDYAVPDVPQFAQFLNQWKNTNVYETSLSAANYLEEGSGPSGTYVLVPTTADHSWAQVRAFTRRLWQNPALGVQMAATRIVVTNNTGRAGVGGQLTDALAKLGYLVDPPRTGSVRNDSRIVDHSGGRAALVVRQLGQDMRASLAVVSDTAGPAGANEIVIELGSDDAGLADLAVSADSEAPASSVGLQQSGTVPPPSASVTPPLPPSPTSWAAPTRTPSYSPLPTHTLISSTATRAPTSAPLTATPVGISPSPSPMGSPTASPSATRSPTRSASSTPLLSATNTATLRPTLTPTTPPHTTSTPRPGTPTPSSTPR